MSLRKIIKTLSKPKNCLALIFALRCSSCFSCSLLFTTSAGHSKPRWDSPSTYSEEAESKGAQTPPTRIEVLQILPPANINRGRSPHKFSSDFSLPNALQPPHALPPAPTQHSHYRRSLRLPPLHEHYLPVTFWAGLLHLAAINNIFFLLPTLLPLSAALNSRSHVRLRPLGPA